MSIASTLLLALMPVLLVQASADAQTREPTTEPAGPKNPLFSGADPDAIVVGDTVWLYPTFSAKRGESAFYAFSSKDLVNWERHGPILSFADIPWIWSDGQKSHGAWAPTVIARNGKYYFYYSVGNQNVTVSRIGVAVGESPAGPFVDSGKPMPIVGARDQFEAIDPMVYVDPKSQKAYLYAGGSNGSKLRVFELKPDMVNIAREVKVDQPEKFTEGAFLHERDGVYYLSYSHGSYRDQTYSVHYATAKSPIGPWQYRGAILESDAKHKGPGHHAFIQSDVSGQWYILYHRWNDQPGDGPYRGSRSVCVEKLEYNRDGTIKPIVMTDTAVPAERFGKAKTTQR
jgi:beta-xylosidase